MPSLILYLNNNYSGTFNMSTFYIKSHIRYMIILEYQPPLFSDFGKKHQNFADRSQGIKKRPLGR